MNACVLVETRELPNLCQIIDNHLRFLKGWKFVMFGSKQNEVLVKQNYPDVDFFDLELTKLNEREYNEVLTSENFWDCLIEYDRVLVFQHDSRLLREGIENFLQYDFIGAPLYHIKFPHMNGGLSIRNPKMMMEICQRYKYNMLLHGNEDIYFCKHLTNVNGLFPTKEEAMKFSVETIFYPTPIGVHCPEKWLK